MITFSRVQPAIACAIILSAFIAWGLANIPDYGKAIYENAQAVDYDKYSDQTGFPAGQGYEELTSYDEIIEAERNYKIVVDVTEMVSTELYKDILGEQYYSKKFAKYNNTNITGGVGTFYLAKLKNGDRVLVFIDDRVFTFFLSGTVELPVASTKKMDKMSAVNKLGEITGLSDEQLYYYVDTAGKWRESQDGQMIKNRALIISCIEFILGSVVLSILFIFLEKRGEKNNGIQ